MASKNPLKHLRSTDARGIAQLAVRSTTGITGVVEGVHQSVWRTLGAPDGEQTGKTRGITGLVYRSIEGITRVLGKGADKTLAWLEPVLASADEGKPSTPQREAVLAALNGVMGDRLADMGNPLATVMTLRYQGQALKTSAPTVEHAKGKLLLVLHGLCMNDLQWTTQHEGQVVNHAEAIAAALGYSPVYVRYNTGLHISQNGQMLATELEALTRHWPVPLEDITVLTHSMGGLVARSALQCAQDANLDWPQRVRHLVFLGTPHHGAPLEKAGNWVDLLLGATPWTAPLGKLAQLRSSGITDLRYGLLHDQDWTGRDRFRRRPDERVVLPLPEGVACYTVAATTAARRSPLADRLIGDGLVPLPSALGQHEDVKRQLVFAKSAQWIAWRTNHMALLSSPAVTEQLLLWLSTPPLHQ